MPLPNTINYSYWELKQYFKKFDLIVIGSGITGLSTAISFMQKNKKANVLVLERGILPNGASTKNAGFACFGSVSELVDDLSKIKEDVVWDTVKMRWAGLQMLRKRLGDKAIGFKQSGGFELFDDKALYNDCLDKSLDLNKKLKSLLGLKNCYNVSKKTNSFNNIKGVLSNQFEGEIDTALMMDSLLSLAQKSGIKVLNGIDVLGVKEIGTHAEIQSNAGIFKAARVVVATNGFASQLLDLKNVMPARAQVLITRPIKNLQLKGTYHYQQGYYYFRNIDNRVLLGGGRNMDFKTETTTQLSLNHKIQQQLDVLLKEMILPGTAFEIEHRWAGIMGVGSEKKPIIQHVSKNVLAAVRMGGMGIAIGSWVGEKAAKEIM